MLAKYRKAIAAFLGTFLASFPLVAWVGDEEIGDTNTLLRQALAAAAVALITALSPKNAEPVG